MVLRLLGITGIPTRQRQDAGGEPLDAVPMRGVRPRAAATARRRSTVRFVCNHDAPERDGVPRLGTGPHFCSPNASTSRTSTRTGRSADPTDLVTLGALWHENPYSPWDEWMLEAMGDLRDRVVVVLGNGRATKGIAPAHASAAGARDLRPVGQRDAGRPSPIRQVRHRLSRLFFFAAIDGQDLPFADASVAVLYGYAFVNG